MEPNGTKKSKSMRSWLKRAKAGDTFVYHNSLNENRDAYVFEEAWRQSDLGRALLFQRKISDAEGRKGYEYQIQMLSSRGQRFIYAAGYFPVRPIPVSMRLHRAAA